MDNLLDEGERIREQYVKVGSKEGPMNEKWIKAAMLQNSLEKVVQALAIYLKKAESVEDIHSIVNTYIYDHRIGMPRGQTTPMRYLAESLGEEEDNTKEVNNVSKTQSAEDDQKSKSRPSTEGNNENIGN